MPVKYRKLSKKSAKEIINPDIKRITVFCIKIRPGRSASRSPAGRIFRRPGRPPLAGRLTTLVKMSFILLSQGKYK
jgi:hypothetical protein